MATTIPYATIRIAEIGSMTVFMEYDETDSREINDDGDPDDFRIIRFFGTNTLTLPLTILVQKGNGQNWFEATFAPGESFDQPAGGPVRYETDLPRWEYQVG